MNLKIREGGHLREHIKKFRGRDWLIGRELGNTMEKGVRHDDVAIHHGEM